MTLSSSLARSRLFDCRVRVLRNPPIDTLGVRLGPVVHIESLLISPIDPVGSDSIQRFVLETPVDMYEAFANDKEDIKTGDIIVKHETGEQFDVKIAQPWAGSHTELILEQRRTNV